MRPAEVVRRGAAYLARHGVESPDVNAEELMLAVLGTGRAGLFSREQGLTPAEAKAYGRALCRRCAGTPLQHITGREGFRHLVLEIRPGVFVPRPETEVAVDAALEGLPGGAVVVDVGTGTGAIALSIAKEAPGSTVWATDLSREAAELARTNASRLGLHIRIEEGDMLDPLPPDLRGKVDLVVSNPPYVPVGRELPGEVLADPPEALFGGPDVYRRLFAQAFGFLKPGGRVVVEIDDHAGQQVSELAAAAGFEGVSVRQDLSGRDRVVAARRP